MEEAEEANEAEETEDTQEIVACILCLLCSLCLLCFLLLPIPLSWARWKMLSCRVGAGRAYRMAKLDEDQPPFLGTWGRLYAFVIGFLFFLILLFYAFTRAYQFPQ